MAEKLTPAAVEAMLTKGPFHQWLGIKVQKVDEEGIELTATWREEWVVNPERRYTHGGILAALVDLTADWALVSHTGRGVPTIDMRVDYHRAAMPGDLTAKGRIVKMGGQFSVAEASVYDKDGKLLASGRGVYLTAPLLLPRADREAIVTVPVNEGHANDAAVPTAASSQREGVFDHAVLNLHYDLDAGEQLFKALGFNVTPRSYHTLGSMNNLIVFGTNYLELIGLDPSNPNPRKELLDWPVGLNGLVYGSDDIDVTAARLRAAKLPVLEPKSFSREVVIDGVTDEARFRTVHLDPGYFAASRLYFCEHQTPHLVWHRAFMSHPNSAHCLKRLAIVSDDFDAQAQTFTRALGLRPDPDARVWSRGTRVDFVSRKRLDNLYHGHADPGSGKAKVAVMGIGVASISALKAAMQPTLAQKLVDIDKSCSLLPASECFGVAIEFLATNVSLV